MKPGNRIRKKGYSTRMGVLSNKARCPFSKQHLLVVFAGKEEFVSVDIIEIREISGAVDPYDTIFMGRFGRVQDPRETITYFRLIGKLASLTHSLNFTNKRCLSSPNYTQIKSTFYQAELTNIRT
jgi:hypothetical protein